MNRFTVILPAGGLKESDHLPYFFDKTPGGNLLMTENIKRLPLEQISSIIITIPDFINEKFSIKKVMQSEMESIECKVPLRIFQLKTKTFSEPETVAQTIKACEVKGHFFVKDPDNLFELTDIEKNGVCVYPLDYLENVTPADKSYVEIDDNQYISNIIEKKIISRFFCTGGYFFEEADEFLTFYKSLKQYANLYMSHVVFAMLLQKKIFRPIHVKSYLDLGTQKKWNNFKQQFATLYINEQLALKNIDLLKSLSTSPFYKLVITSDKHISVLNETLRKYGLNNVITVADVFAEQQIMINNSDELEKFRNKLL